MKILYCNKYKQWASFCKSNEKPVQELVDYHKKTIPAVMYIYELAARINITQFKLDQNKLT
jgi:hypothetical protein